MYIFEIPCYVLGLSPILLFTKLSLPYHPCFNLHTVTFTLDFLRKKEGTMWVKFRGNDSTTTGSSIMSRWPCSPGLGPRRSFYHGSSPWEIFKVSPIHLVWFPGLCIKLLSWPPDIERFLTTTLLSKPVGMDIKFGWPPCRGSNSTIERFWLSHQPTRLLFCSF